MEKSRNWVFEKYIGWGIKFERENKIKKKRKLLGK